MSLEKKVEELLARMTLDEKALLTAGLDIFATHPIPRLGIPSLKMCDGPNGVRFNGTATAFPTGIVMAASFDEDLLQRVGAALARECKAKGRHVLLGPCVNLQRHPYGGRNFESFGEDPWLASRIAIAWIKGVQGQGVAASLKHFAANNQETNRFSIDTVVDEKVLRELYFPHFEMVVKEAGPLTVMAAYNKVNGRFSSANKWMLTEVLRKEWGFDGLVVSDWMATHEGPGAAEAGLDLEMPGPGRHMGLRLAEAVKKGELKEEVVTEQARRFLRLLFRLGLFEKDWGEDPAELHRPETQALSRELAEAGTVLLKNEGVLPLDAAKIKKLAVIGPSAAAARPGGGGSSQVEVPFAISPLEGLKRLLGTAVEINYSAGIALDDDLQALPEAAFESLEAEYFNNMELQGEPVLRRREARIDYDWGDGSPDPLVLPDHFSARWTGAFIGPEDGEYRLGLYGDDGFRLHVDGKFIVGNWNDHNGITLAAPFKMEKGRRYAFTVELYQNLGKAGARLCWKKAQDLVPAAVEAAKAADAALVFVGLSSDYESEGFDRTQWGLPGGQDELIRRICAANPRTAVVLLCGSPVDVESWVDAAKAILIGWFPGMLGGDALARLLFGRANPSGKLPMSWPKKLEDLASHKNWPGDKEQVRYEEGLAIGYRHFQLAKIQPRWPFGHGYSYSRFKTENLKWEKGRLHFKIKNLGQWDGAETVMHFEDKGRGFKELVAFKKVFLKAGEEKVL